MNKHERRLAQAYVNQFGEQPDDMAKTIIKLAAPRLEAGEQFRWIFSAGGRVLMAVRPNKEGFRVPK